MADFNIGNLVVLSTEAVVQIILLGLAGVVMAHAVRLIPSPDSGQHL